MASFRAKKVSDSESYLDVNLKELFGVDNVPDNSAFRQEVGQAIIDTIRKRADDNKFLSPAKKTYSEEYTESLEFEVAGKSEDDVNLKLTGDMLAFMNVIDERPDGIRIGWDDDEEVAKATNHNFGVTVPRREFLGLTQKESDDLKAKFSSRIDKVQDQESTSSSVDQLSRFVAGEFGLQQSQDERSIFASLVSGIGRIRGSSDG